MRSRQKPLRAWGNNRTGCPRYVRAWPALGRAGEKLHLALREGGEFEGLHPGKAHESALTQLALEQVGIARARQDGRASGFMQGLGAVGVVKMQVGEQHVGERQVMLREKTEHGPRVSACIHGQRARAFHAK